MKPHSHQACYSAVLWSSSSTTPARVVSAVILCPWGVDYPLPGGGAHVKGQEVGLSAGRDYPEEVRSLRREPRPRPFILCWGGGRREQFGSIA